MSQALKKIPTNPRKRKTTRKIDTTGFFGNVTGYIKAISLQQCREHDGGNDNDVEAKVEEFIGAVLDAKNSVVLAIHAVQASDGSDLIEVEDNIQLTYDQ